MKSEFCKDGFVPTAVGAIRLIATDLDGTLLRPDGSISQYTLSELRRVQEAGMLVVLVSARPPRAMRQLAQSSGLGGLAICCNGLVGASPLLTPILWFSRQSTRSRARTQRMELRWCFKIS